MKVLFVGLGSIGKKHLNALLKLNASIQIFALRSGIKNEEIVGVYDIYKFSQVPKDLTFSIIANPTFEHFNSLKMLIPLGKPIFIEKPPLDSLLGSKELIEMIERYSTRTYVGFNLRFLTSLMWLKQNLNTKEVIEVSVYCGSFLPNWRKGDYRTSYSADRNKGGGVQLDLIHELDYVIWIFGYPKAVQKFDSKFSTLDITSSDYSFFHLIYADKCISIKLNYYRQTPKRDIEIISSKEIIYVDLLKNNVRINNKIVHQGDGNILNTYDDQLSYFIENLNSGKEFPNNFENSLKTLKIVLTKNEL